MRDAKSIIQMLIKAPTLFIYSIYSWGRKIDSHKIFLTCVLQEALLVIIALVYATTPSARIEGTYLLIVACVANLFVSYVLCGCPTKASYWKYLITGKATEDMVTAYYQQIAQKKNSSGEQTEQNVNAENQDKYDDFSKYMNPPVYEDDEPEQESSPDISEQEYDNIAEKIIIDDTASATVEQKQDDSSEVTLESLSHSIDEDDLDGIVIEDLTANSSEGVTADDGNAIEPVTSPEAIPFELVSGCQDELDFTKLAPLMEEDVESKLETEFHKNSVDYKPNEGESTSDTDTLGMLDIDEV